MKLNINTISFEHNIWKIHQYTPETLLVELRNADSFLKKYYLLSIETLKKTAINHQLDDWWWLLTFASAPYLVFEKYKPTRNIEKTALAIFNQSKGEIEYQSSEDRIVHLTNREIQTQEKKFDLHNQISDTRGQKLPTLYTSEEQDFEEFRFFFKEKYNLEIQNRVEYMEHEGFVLISYYLQDRSELENHFLILDSEGNEMMHRPLVKNDKGVGMDSYYITGNYVIVLPLLSEIEVIELKN